MQPFPCPPEGQDIGYTPLQHGSKIFRFLLKNFFCLFIKESPLPDPEKFQISNSNSQFSPRKSFPPFITVPLSSLSRKEGKDRLIKIIARDDRVGFREDLLDYTSLHELVEHFRKHSLKGYNEKLDVKLKYPCKRVTQKKKVRLVTIFQHISIFCRASMYARDAY